MKRHDTEKMRQMYDQWQLSGLSMKAFSEQHDIHPKTFYYWAKVIKKEISSSLDNGKGFSRIPLLEPYSDQCPKPATIICLPSGARIEFYYPVEASLIKTLIQ